MKVVIEAYALSLSLSLSLSVCLCELLENSQLPTAKYKDSLSL